MFSRSKEELASIEDGQNSRVEKEVLLRSGWYDCVLSLVVLFLWDAKSMIVSRCTGCRKGHQKIQKRLKVSSSCSQPEYRNSLKRWALNFLYIYIHIHFHIPVYIFIFLPNLVSSWKRTLLSEERVVSLFPSINSTYLVVTNYCCYAQVLSPAFGGMTAFIKETEPLLERGQGQVIRPDERMYTLLAQLRSLL